MKSSEKRVFDFTKTPERITFLEERVDELQGNVNDLTDALDNVEKAQMVILCKMDTAILLLEKLLKSNNIS